MAQKKPKKYDMNQSPLYKLHSKKKLAALLNLNSASDLNTIQYLEEPYRKFCIENKGKQRAVEVPSGPLLPIHNRLFKLLKRIELPDYLHSGTKGRSYLSNAKAHLGQNTAYTLDIKKFYPSVSRAKVAAFFRNQMLCSEDVAGVLANLTTCEGNLPTGSSISQLLAYLSCREMFDAIYDASATAGIRMTCYVDDLTFSGDDVTKKWIHECIKPIIIKFDMVSHKDKYFGINQIKEITGVIIDGNEMKVLNRMHKSIYELLLQSAELEDTQKLTTIYNRLVGKLSAAGQIDERFNRHRQITVAARKDLVQN